MDGSNKMTSVKSFPCTGAAVEVSLGELGSDGVVDSTASSAFSTGTSTGLSSVTTGSGAGVTSTILLAEGSLPQASIRIKIK
jgi:hypothetical protein